MVEVVWNPEPLPSGEICVVLHVHQHSLSPLKATLGYFDPTAPGFVASDENPPIKIAFRQAMTYAKKEGVNKLVIVDPVGFGRLALKGLVE